MEYIANFTELLEYAYEGIYYVDKNRKITFWNKGAERITGFPAAEVVGSFCYNNILNHVDDEGNRLCIGGCPLHQTIQDGSLRETSVYLHHKNGHRVPVAVKTIPIYDSGVIVGAVEMFQDNYDQEELLKSVEELTALAMIDQLTQLGNRRYTESILTSKMNTFRETGSPFGVAFMDIDHFRNFNNTYGHDLGDEVLKMVADTFLINTRSTDHIGRWGGEEFLGVFTCPDAESLKITGEKIRMLVEGSKLRKKDEDLSVTISLGLAQVKDDDTIDSLLKRADAQLYISKASGRNCISLDPS